MSQVLELRVLSGLHEGACCEIAHGAVIGADLGCDIVLADEGLGAREAQVCLDTSGWHLSATTDAPPSRNAFGFNQPLQLGPIWITVARREDPWVAPPMDAGAGSGMTKKPEPEMEPGSDDAAPEPHAADESSTDAPVAAAIAASDTAAARRPRRVWPVAVGLFSVVASIMLAIALALVPGAGGTQPAGEDSGRIAVEQSMARIAAVIERLGLASRVRVSLSDNGLATVSGWVRDTAEQDELATALAQVWPMPAMRISNQAEVVQVAQAALSGFSIRYEVKAGEDGKLALRGIANSPAEGNAALEALRSQVPGMTVADVDIRLAADVSSAFAALLREAQMDRVSLDWQGDRLAVVPGRLGMQQRQKLLGLAEAFNAEHLGVVQVILPPANAVADTVPFGIRSVIGGEQAYLVLSDGTKLLPGGVYRDYRLVSIEADRIVFDGEQRASVPR